MSEQTSRDEAVRVGAEALESEPPGFALKEAKAVLDAAHKAGLISYQDEWEQVDLDSPESYVGGLFIRRRGKP